MERRDKTGSMQGKAGATPVWPPAESADPLAPLPLLAPSPLLDPPPCASLTHHCRRNPDAWALGNGSSAYISSLPVQADEGLTQSLLSEARAALGEDSVVTGLNATADSFYSSQV